MNRTGKVSFVGAGPGRPELMTERGRRLLERADTVLYDYLADERLLEFAPLEADRICLGKHGRQRIWPQDAIADKLVELAQLGQHVVRLKGGDPALFARLGEELEALKAHDIEYEIVPGVTAALGAAAYDSISLTHRDWASAVALVTGQEAPDKFGRPIDFRRLADFPGTIVVYMGVTTVERWSRELIEGGKPPETPVLAIRRATWPDQYTCSCRLDDLPERVRQERLRPPIVFVVGEAAEGPGRSWYERLPLFGQQIVVTRPRRQATALRELLEEQGAATYSQPAIAVGEPASFDALDQALDQLDQFDWIVFSSTNGVEFFLRRLWQRGADLRSLGSSRLAAIGSATARALESRSLRADLIPPTFRSEELAELLVPQASGKRFLLVRASRGRELLGSRLSESGAQVTQVVAYRNEDVTSADEQITKMLRAGTIDWITVTSSAIARSLVRLWGEDLRRANLVSISPVTSTALRELGFEPAAEAETYTMEGLVDAIIRAVK